MVRGRLWEGKFLDARPGEIDVEEEEKNGQAEDGALGTGVSGLKFGLERRVCARRMCRLRDRDG